jgi:hypothetical protein
MLEPSTLALRLRFADDQRARVPRRLARSMFVRARRSWGDRFLLNQTASARAAALGRFDPANAQWGLRLAA